MIKGETAGRKFGLSDEQHERGKAQEALRNSFRKRYTSILDRWTKDDVYRASKLGVGWIEQVKQMDQLALEDHTYHATKDEMERYNKMWTLKRIRMDMRKKTRIQIIRITAQLFKKHTKFQLQTLPYRLAFQDPNSTSTSKRGKHAGMMNDGTTSHRGAGINGATRHPNSIFF